GVADKVVGGNGRGLAGHRAWTKEDIVLDHNRRRAWRGRDERSRWGIIGKSIVDDEQLLAGIARVCALLQVGDKRRVVIERTLFDHISYHIREPAVGDVNLVTRGPGGFIAQPVVENKILRGACLEQMADLGVMGIVVPED